jgi:hypothetical protein
MDSDAQEAAKRAELKERLEEIAGRELDMTDEQLSSVFRPMTSSAYLGTDYKIDDVWITSERVINPQPICMDASLLDIGGLSVTGSNGQLVFRLSRFDCQIRHGFNQYEEPVILLATPQGTSPFLMTMNHKLIKDDPALLWYNDLEITASSWNPTGKAAANVPFYWRCRVPAYTNPV